MPRHGGKSVPRIERGAFRVLYSTASRTTTGVTFTQYNLVASNLGDRASFIAENFEFFRLTRLKIYTYTDVPGPAGGTSNLIGTQAFHALGFMNTPSGSQTAPTSVALMSQQEYFKTGGALQRLEIDVGRAQLLSEPLKWYNTYTTGSVPASTLSAGTITVAHSLTVPATVSGFTVNVVAEGVIEYHTPIDSTDSLRLRVPRSTISAPPVAKALLRLKEAVEEAETGC